LWQQDSSLFRKKPLQGAGLEALNEDYVPDVMEINAFQLNCLFIYNGTEFMKKKYCPFVIFNIVGLSANKILEIKSFPKQN
jgi:hypothetical protein